MSKNNDFLLTLHSDSNEPVYFQLRNAIAESLSSGSFQPGQQISSIRTISAHLGAKANVVRSAFDQLIGEGWLESRQGSGTSIAANAPLLAKQKSTIAAAAGNATPPVKSTGCFPYSANDYQGPFPAHLLQEFVDATISGAGASVMSEYTSLPIQEPCTGVKYERSIELWKGDLQTKPLLVSEPAGLFELRECIANWLNQSRGMNCVAANVVIMNNVNECRNFVARLFVERGSVVVVEDPNIITSDLQASQAVLQPIGMDDSGILPDELDEIANARLAFVTTSCQIPSGSVLSRPRRKRIAEWAHRHKALIVEDDSNCEFTFDSRLLPPIHAVDESDRTIYIGSLGAILPRQMQLAFAVVPNVVRAPYVRLKSIANRCTSPILQRLVFHLFETGYLSERVKKLQRVLEDRRSLMLELLKELAPPSSIYTPAKAGCFQTIWLPVELDDVSLAAQCAPQNVLPISSCCITLPRPGLMLNFSQDKRIIESSLRQLFDPDHSNCRKDKTGIEI